MFIVIATSALPGPGRWREQVFPNSLLFLLLLLLLLLRGRHIPEGRSRFYWRSVSVSLRLLVALYLRLEQPSWARNLSTVQLRGVIVAADRRLLISVRRHGLPLRSGMPCLSYLPGGLGANLLLLCSGNPEGVSAAVVNGEGASNG